MNRKALLLASTLLFMIVAGLFLWPKITLNVQPKTSVLNDVFELQQMEISSFDPLDAYHAGHIQVVKQLYNTLADIDAKGEIEPSLSEKWETNDGQHWRFYLRTGVLFHASSCFAKEQNREFVASDVKFTFERLLATNSKSLGVSYFLNIVGVNDFRNGTKSEIEGIQIVDTNIIDFILTKTNFSFPSLLSLPYAGIVKKQAVDYFGPDFKLHPVGTGPFVLKEYKPDLVGLSKNKEYWEKSDSQSIPQIDDVRLHLVADDNLALAMFRNREVDFLELSYALLKQVHSPAFPIATKTETKETAQLNFYLFNLGTMTDAVVRRAVSYALDRERLQQFLGDYGVVASSFYPPALFGALSDPRQVLSYQPDNARELVGRLKSLKLVSFEDVMSRALAMFVADCLKPYGVMVQIESVPFPVIVERLTKGEYDLIQIYWGPLYVDANHYASPFLSASAPPAGNNFNRYSNSTFDNLINRSSTLKDIDQIESLKEAENIILNDMPFLLLFYKNTVRISNGKIDMPLHPLQYRMYKYAKPL